MVEMSQNVLIENLAVMCICTHTQRAAQTTLTVFKRVNYSCRGSYSRFQSFLRYRLCVPHGNHYPTIISIFQYKYMPLLWSSLSYMKCFDWCNDTH